MCRICKICKICKICRNAKYAKYAEYAKYAKYEECEEYDIWDIAYNLPISPITLSHINNYTADLSSTIWSSTTTRATVVQQIKLIYSGRVSIILTIVRESQYFWQQWSSFNTFDNSGRATRCVGNEKCPPHQSGAPSKQGHFNA